jgi:integrase
MASLTKDSKARSKFWICCYTAADGRQLKKSTKQTDRKKAWEFCLAIQRAEDEAKKGLLTEQTAKKLIGEILERTTGESLHDYKAREWFEHWLQIKGEVRTRQTSQRYRQVISEFIDSLGAKANLPLAHITSKDILAYRDSILAAKNTARTANLAVVIVSAAFNAAVRQGHIQRNPCTALESLRVSGEERSTFSPEQISKLLRAADRDWRGAIMVAYYTGARATDVANMQWHAIDWRNKLIRFTPSKTRKPVTIPLHLELERELLKKPGIGKAFLFPSLAGRVTGGARGLSPQFAAIMKKAGVEGKIVSRASGRTFSSLSFHSLRHSFNSAMANAGVSQEIRQALTGHSSAEMNKLYTHHELEPLRAAIAVIPRLSDKE